MTSSCWCTTGFWFIRRNRNLSEGRVTRVPEVFDGIFWGLAELAPPNSIHPGRPGGKHLEGKAVRRRAAAINGKVKIFGNLAVIRQQRKIHPLAETFWENHHGRV